MQCLGRHSHPAQETPHDKLQRILALADQSSGRNIIIVIGQELNSMSLLRHISNLQRESLLFLSAMSYQAKGEGTGKGKKKEEQEEMAVKEECSGKVVRSAICIWKIRVCPHLPRFYSFPHRGKDTSISPVLLLYTFTTTIFHSPLSKKLLTSRRRLL